MRIERQASSAARWSSRIAWFALVLMLTAIAAHRFELVETIPFLWTLGLTGGLALLALLVGIAAFRQMWEYGFTGVRAASFGVMLSLTMLVPYGLAAALYSAHPPLTDVMTDVAYPPEFIHAAKLRQPPMNPIVPLSQSVGLAHLAAYPALAPRRFEYAREQVLEAVLALMERRGWTVLTPLPEEAEGGVNATSTVEAAAKTFVLGIPFDVAVRVEDRSDATYVDMRSVSRYGPHDLGMNASQIRSFLKDLESMLTESGNV